MPTIFPGDYTAVTPGAQVSLTGPADGDGLNAASVNGEIEDSANFLEFLRRIIPGFTTEAGPVLTDNNITFTDRKLIFEFLAGTTHVRFYKNDTRLEIVANAYWTDASNVWAYDTGAQAARFLFNEQGLVMQYFAGATGWADGSWNVTQSLTATNGRIDSTGNITANAGDITAAVGNIVATLGNIVASAGNITATLGDITASDGNVTAAGTPSGNAGPGLLKGKRLYSTGTAMTNGQFATLTNWGGSPSVSSCYGTDTGGFVVILSDAGGAADPSFVFTFKDGTFTNAPAFLCQFAFTDDGTIDVDNAAVQIDNLGATSVRVTLKTNGVTPTAAKSFRFHWTAIGV